MQEWDDTEDPRASDAFKAQVATKQAMWEAEGIPYKHVSHGHGLRNRIVRMPLLEGTVSMTIDGKAGCKKLMGRINNPDLGSMRILHLPNSWNHAMADHLIAFQVIPLGPQKTQVTTKWIVTRMPLKGLIMILSIYVRCGMQLTCKIVPWRKTTSAVLILWRINLVLIPQHLSLVWLILLIGLATRCKKILMVN